MTILKDFQEEQDKEFEDQAYQNLFPQGYFPGKVTTIANVKSYIHTREESLLKRIREEVEKKKESWATGLVYLTDGFPVDKQWEAAEAHVQVIVDDILKILS